MIHPDVELKFINEEIGYGVFARKLIPAGTITYVKDPLEIEITPDHFLLHPKEMQEIIDKYSYLDENGTHIISWDIAKFVNHCCNCNTISTGYGFEIALRDIHPGEQITDEYGLFNIKEEMPLTCQYSSCRKCLKNTDFDMYYEEWDKKIKKAFPALFTVHQPLLKFMDQKTQVDLQNYLNNPSTYKSVKVLKLKDTAKV